MSLWYKSIDDIEFQDIDDFCQLRLTEGSRLEYKGDLPRKLEKNVAAFANTFGGLIVLGVAADQTSNQPILPVRGMASRKGISEQIIATCRDAIYPPVRPEVRIVEVPGTGHVVAVVRIPESPKAPHAINNGTAIYERTGDQTHPIERANIDRIEQLLRRRAGIEIARENLVDDALQRAERVNRNRDEAPCLWAAVVPVFPWRDLCSPATCYELHSGWTYFCDRLQRVPRGSVGLGKLGTGARMWLRFGNLDSRGLIFGHEQETDRGPGIFLGFNSTCVFAHRVFIFARRFFEHSAVEMPGFIRLYLGITHASRLIMHCGSATDRLMNGFPDAEFRTEVTVPIQELLEKPASGRLPAFERRLFEDLSFGFDFHFPGEQSLLPYLQSS